MLSTRSEQKAEAFISLITLNLTSLGFGVNKQTRLAKKTYF